MLKSSGAQVSYASPTSPTCSLTAVSDNTDAVTVPTHHCDEEDDGDDGTDDGGDDAGGGGWQGASMVLDYETVTVYYLNTSSNAEVALYRFPINDSDYTRTRVLLLVAVCRVVCVCRALTQTTAAAETTAFWWRCWCRCWWAGHCWWWSYSPSASSPGSCGRSARPTARTSTAT